MAAAGGGGSGSVCSEAPGVGASDSGVRKGWCALGADGVKVATMMKKCLWAPSRERVKL